MKKQLKQDLLGHAFILPVIISLLAFVLFPMILSMYYSFFDYNVISKPKNFGLQNYINPFSAYVWPTFSKSISVTLIYTVIAVPLNIVLSFAVALFLAKRRPGIKFFRLLYYSPAILPPVIAGLMWRDIANVEFGIANALLRNIGVAPFSWFSNESTAMFSFIAVGWFGLGGGMILWLAQINNIPPEIFESARIDGAGAFRRTFLITIPLCTPMIFYNLILNIIGSLQTCAGVFVITGGTQGPNNSLLFYVVNVYFAAFQSYQMGAACALAWMLFVVIALLTAVIFKTSRWVFYGE